MSDESITIPESLPAEEIQWAEFELWVLRAAAFISRKKVRELGVALTQMRGRLSSTSQGEGLQVQIYRLYYTARYYHLLLEHWKVQTEEIEDSVRVDGREGAYGTLDSWLRERCICAPPNSRTVQEHIFERAQADYQRALQISSMLILRGLLLEGGFHLGSLLLDFAPEEVKAHSSWWEKSDSFFETCLKIEGDSGLRLHAPEIHRHRWHFFGEQDRSASILDAFHTLEAVRGAAYPDKVALEWHQMVGSLLTHYGHKREYYPQRSDNGGGLQLLQR